MVNQNTFAHFSETYIEFPFHTAFAFSEVDTNATFNRELMWSSLLQKCTRNMDKPLQSLLHIVFMVLVVICKEYKQWEPSGIYTLNTDCSQKAILLKKASVSFHAKSFMQSIVSVYCSMLFMVCVLAHKRTSCYCSHQQWLSWWRSTVTTLTSQIESPRDSVSTQYLVMDEDDTSVSTIVLLCVSYGWSVMYGDHCGVTDGARLLYVVSLCVVLLRSGQLEVVLRGRVWVKNTARHRVDSQVAQRHVALNGGLWQLRSRFGAAVASEDSGYMCPPVVRLQDDQKNGENKDGAYDDDSDHCPRTLDEYLFVGLCDGGSVWRDSSVGHRWDSWSLHLQQ